MTYATPRDFFDKLNEEFQFTLDACATADNAKCDRFFTPEQNGLLQHWNGVVWCNPPYTHGHLGRWVEKAHISATLGATVVILVPVYSDANWWHDYIARAAEIRFVRGRLTFGGQNGRALFPSAVVVFRKDAPWGPVLRSIDSGRNRKRGRR